MLRTVKRAERRFRRSLEAVLMHAGCVHNTLTCNAGPRHTGITLTWRIRAVTGGRILHVTETGHRSGSRYGRGVNTRHSRPSRARPRSRGNTVPAARSLPYPGNPDMRSTAGRRRASSKSAKRRLRARLIHGPQSHQVIALAATGQL